MTTLAPPSPPVDRPVPAAPVRPPRRRAQGDPTLIAPTLCGALAVWTGAAALWPLIEGAGWMLPLAEVVAVVWLVGVGARLIGTPRWAVTVLQLAGLAIAVTSLYTTTGVAGVLPGPAAIDQAGSMLGLAWHQILVTVAPAPATAELGLFIALTTGLVAVVVDGLIAGAGTPALVALPLLGLYSVPAAIADELLPWQALVLPAACYVTLLALSGHRGAAGGRRASVAIGTSGVLIAALSIGAAMAAGVVLTGVGTAGRIPHSSHSTGAVGLSPWANLRGDLTDKSPVDVLRVAGLTQPAYLRTFTLDRWTPNKGFGLGSVTADDRDVDGAIPDAKTPTGGTVTATVTPQEYRDKYLPIYPGSTAVGDIGPGWDYDRTLQTVFRPDPVIPGPYTVTAPAGRATADELRGEDVRTGGTMTDTAGIPAQVADLARSLTADADTPFDKVDALLNYFTDPANGFRYSLSTAEGNSGSALVDFLTTKEGYCEQYAAAMAAMVRTLGIPARVGIGFTQGALQPDGSYQITSRNAHAWVEVRFDKTGWVIFDPTPAVDGQGGLQGFVSGQGSGDDGVPGDVPSGAAATPTAPTTALSLEGVIPTQGRTIPDLGAQQGAAADGDAPLGGHLTTLLIALAVAALIALLLAAPSQVRAARRRRRLAAAAAGAPDGASAAWREIADTAADHGIDVDTAASVRATANRVARHAQLSSRERDELRTVVTGAEREWYADGGVAVKDDLAPGVRAVISALRRTSPRSWWDRIFPRSLRR